MIELERHIEILLLDNDCVIVPNLGGFMAHHVEAHFDDNDMLFLPPSRTLGFNPKLRLNDSLLAQSYIEAYDISYPEAMNRIEDEVNELKQTLQNEGVYELNDIGTLSMNEDGNYEFMPCEAGILTPALYGLSSFDMSVNKSADLPLPVQEKQEEEPVVAEQETVTEEPAAKTISIRVSAIRNAVAIAAAILAFFLITTPVGTQDKAGMNLSNIENSMLYRVMPKEMTSTKTDVQLQNESVQKEQQRQEPAKNETPLTEEKQQETAKMTPQSHYWSIVLASKVSLKNAQAFVGQLTQEGFPQAKVLTKKSGNRVIYGSYGTEQEAYQALRSLRGHSAFEEAWVYEVK